VWENRNRKFDFVHVETLQVTAHKG